MVKVTTIIIRKLRKDDFTQVTQLLSLLMGEFKLDKREYREIWNKNFTSDHYKGFVAIIDGKIVGYIDVIFFQDIAHGGVLGQIQNFIVHPQYRGRGFGEALLNYVIDFAKKNNFLELHVWTEFDNKRAIALYERLGFEKRSLLLEYEFE